MDFLQFREPVSAWTHCVWMLLAIPGTFLLWKRSRGQRGRQISLLIFGLTLIYCYAGSTLFHAVHHEPWIHIFHKLDHVGIYLLIAGSYTPVAAVILRGRWRWGVLSLAWLMAVIGILLRLLSTNIPGVVSTSYYLVMGWGAILCYFELARILSHRALFPVVLGGIFYSIGAVINLADWPVMIAGVFGAHELFHVFVMAGSLAHFWFVLRFVVPFKRRRTRSSKMVVVAATPLMPAGPE